MIAHRYKIAVGVLLFYGLRIGDITSTYLNMAKYDGWGEIEAVAFNAWLIDAFGYHWLVVINLLVSTLLLLAILKVVPRLYWVVVAIMALVVLNNTVIYLLI